jgi:hypothetical protein
MNVLSIGDTVTFEGVARHHWFVRFTMWLTRTKLAPPARPLRQFIVTYGDRCDD